MRGQDGATDKAEGKGKARQPRVDRSDQDIESGMNTHVIPFDLSCSRSYIFTDIPSYMACARCLRSSRVSDMYLCHRWHGFCDRCVAQSVKDTRDTGTPSRLNCQQCILRKTQDAPMPRGNVYKGTYDDSRGIPRVSSFIVLESRLWIQTKTNDSTVSSRRR